MIELLNKYHCSECKRSWSLDSLEIKEMIDACGVKTLMNEKVKCYNCKNEFVYYQGLIDELVENEHFGGWKLIYDTIISETAKVVVGNEYKVTLPQEVFIKKILLTCIDSFAIVGADFEEQVKTKGFSIVSSESAGNHEYKKKVGEEQKVNWILYGKSGNEPDSIIWIVLLKQIKELILQHQYNLAVLTAEMMFESFLDGMLNKMLISKGLSEKSSYIIIESIGSIYNKAHKLLRELSGQGLNDVKVINKEWIKLMEIRNKVAHGENLRIDKEKAKWALRTALDAIFLIYNNQEVEE